MTETIKNNQSVRYNCDYVGIKCPNTEIYKDGKCQFCYHMCNVSERRNGNQ